MLMSFNAHSAGSTLAFFTCKPTCATVPWLRTASQQVLRPASVPEHSMAESTPTPSSVSSRSISTTLTARGSTTRAVTPNASICRRRLGLGSLTKIFEAPSAAGERGKRSDRSGAGDQHGAAATDLGALDAVERHRRRLDQRALLVVDAVGQRVGIVVVDDRVFAHAAPRPGQTDAAHLRTQMVETAAAVVVVERHHQRLDRDAVALADPGHVLADFDNLGREFVTEDLRQRRAGELMRVASA